MALRQWSSEIYTAEFRELQASTFCCSRDGRLGLLAGNPAEKFQFCLCIITKKHSNYFPLNGRVAKCQFFYTEQNPRTKFYPKKNV